jgi:filamentous hemagglutinin family protein
MIRKPVAVVVVLHLLASSVPVFGAATIPGFHGSVSLPTPPAVNTLPSPRGNAWTGVQSITTDTSSNRMVINQNASRAVIDWNSFDIGANASVHFNQKDEDGVAQKDWAALNRIYERNPSQIYGSLTADGKVYLINRNGILFGPGSRVNVHSLIASTHDIDILGEDYDNGVLTFRADPDQDPTAMVANYGTLAVDKGGTILLIAPEVVNGGTIEAPEGAVMLISAVPLAKRPDDSTSYDVRIDTDNSVLYNYYVSGGVATNYSGGLLGSDAGKVAMFGRVVNQEGIIRSVTTVKKSGVIELRATERVTTGPESSILSPISDSDETVNSTYFRSADRYESGKFGGQVTLAGWYGARMQTSGSSSVYQEYMPLASIVHQGEITAPAGTVSLFATDRVFLENNSSIDVSGLWVDMPASSTVLSVQLTSTELSDSYGQKNGILQGETVNVDSTAGTTIANISGAYTSRDKTAREAATKGGRIDTFLDLLNNTDEIVVKEGARLDFSGGGYNYADGTKLLSMLVSGTRVYDMATASTSITYDTILGSQETTYARYGVTETFSGISLGGANSLLNYSPGYSAGSDAGSLTLAAKRVVLDGTIDGSVTRGVYQVKTTAYTKDDHAAYDLSVAMGLEIPVAGKLTVGNNPDTNDPSKTDFITTEIVLKPETEPLAASFGADDPLTGDITYLSAARLSSSGLSSITLNANTSFTSAADSVLTLSPASSLTVRARSITHYGEIIIPSGTVDLSLYSTYASFATDSYHTANPDYSFMNGRVWLARGSVIDVAGERVDNTAAARQGTDPVLLAYTGGGSVTLHDYSDEGTGVFLASGSRVDVGGGYLVDTAGKVTGGDGGTLDIMGPTIGLQGDVSGLAIAGKKKDGTAVKGGKIVLHAGEVTVTENPAGIPANLTADTAIPDDLYGTLQISPERFAGTGFTRIELKSQKDLTVETGAILRPDSTRLASPAAGGGDIANNTDGQGTSSEETLVATPDFLGATSVSLSAGVKYFIEDGRPVDSKKDTDAEDNALLSVAYGGGVRVAPGGSITLSGPEVSMAGLLEALAGTVSVTATKLHDLTVDRTGEILAGGYNRLVQGVVAGVPAGYTALSGGTVTLRSSEGSLNLETGSLVDVSGSEPVTGTVASADGSAITGETAGAAGSLTLTLMKNLVLDGEVRGAARMDGLQGGTLTLSLLNSGGALNLTAERVTLFQGLGFDALTFRSAGELSLAGGNGETISVARSLTLDAPRITGSGVDEITLSSPWITVTNTSLDASSAALPDTGSGGKLTLAGQWLNLGGSVVVGGFGDVLLEAEHDIRLTDLQPSGSDVWNGRFAVSDNLTLQAARIYPTTLSLFTIAAGGGVTILPSANRDTTPVWSAGGSLTITAGQGIEQRGTLAAPLGSITLNAPDGRVYLSEESVTTTTAETQVSFGSLDSSGSWTYLDHATNKYVEVTDVPGKKITLTGNEVIVRDGAVIDASGGGSVYAELWQAGLEGTVNPFDSLKKRYVVLPGNPLTLTGEMVWLSGSENLPAGYYSLLPEQYAFLPGAMVVTSLGITVSSDINARTADGYRIVAGYATTAGTDLQPARLSGYTVRTAADVLKEGNFSTSTITAGDGGTISLRADTTTVLDGTVRAAALTGFSGGTLDLSGSRVTVQSEVEPLPELFGFSSPIPDSLAGTLRVAASSLSGQGFGEVRLGYLNPDNASDIANTSTVTIRSGSALDVPVISLAARDTVVVEDGVRITAVGSDGAGSVTMTSLGTVTIGEGAVVRAASSISVDAPGIDYRGSLVVDNGSLSLAAAKIFITDDAETDRSETGLYLTDSQWSALSSISAISLKSSSDIVFRGDHDLNASNALAIDTGRIAGQGDVRISALELTLRNSGATTSSSLAATGTLEIGADRVTLGPGTVLLDGFSSIGLTSAGDLTLTGSGALIAGWGGYSADNRMTIRAPRITSELLAEADGSFTATDFLFNASNGLLTLEGGGTAGAVESDGGTLVAKANRIDLSTLIDMPSGTVRLIATDTGPAGGVFLSEGARILAQGTRFTTAESGVYQYAPGGVVELSGAAGTIVVGKGAVIDVSAAGTGDAGSVVLSAPGGVSVAGTVTGIAASGRGGSLSLDTADANTVVGGGFSSLLELIAQGGFTGSVSLRSRNGDLELGVDEGIAAQEIRLIADSGAIDIKGTLTGRKGSNGGSIALYSRDDLTLSGAVIAAARKDGAAACGGDVSLGSVSGTLRIEGGVIDVSGGAGGEGGTVALRAARNANTDAAAGPVGVNMDLNGEIRGASAVTAEGFKAFDKSGTITATDMNTWKNDTTLYMTNAAAIRSDLLSGLTMTGMEAGAFHFRPGVEVRSSGNLTLSTAWNLSSWRYDGEPGMLTLRAAGNLTLNNDLTDAPTARGALLSTTAVNTWGITLAAGAELTSADTLSVKTGSGDLKVADTKVVYSEKAPVAFAAGNDVLVGSGRATGYMVNSTLRYSIGSYAGDVTGYAGRDLVVSGGGGVETAVGDVDLQVGRNLYLSGRNDDMSANLSAVSGAIRTTGEADTTANMTKYQTYAGGGDISVDVGGFIAGTIPLTGGWDSYYTVRRLMPDGSTKNIGYWIPDYTSTATRGIAAMGGGDVEISARGDFYGQAGTFGVGDLRLFSGGDLAGRLLVRSGTGEVWSMGSVGSPSSLEQGNTVLELFDARAGLFARGNIDLGAVLNPSLANSAIVATANTSVTNITYSHYDEEAGTLDSAVNLAAQSGDVNIYGKTFYYASVLVDVSDRVRILPPVVEVYAGRDIRLENDLTLSPSSTGNLVLVALNDIIGEYTNKDGCLDTASIRISDTNPALWYGLQVGLLENTNILHGETPLHTGDSAPVVVSAGRDLNNLSLVLPKMADISAGRDIRALQFEGQNIGDGDVTIISAGRNIILIPVIKEGTVLGSESLKAGITLGGPGTLLAQAGGDIDLSTSKGIKTVGNLTNPALSETGADLIVLAGIDTALSADAAAEFFDELRIAGTEYSELKAEGKTKEAQERIERARSELIEPLFGGSVNNGSGIINMTSSQISSLAEGSDVTIIARGDMNVGRSTFVSDADRTNTGIFTALGGDVNIFSGGDLNVNESRVMTFRGGDITVWSDLGSVNAGRGSKTTISVAAPKYDTKSKSLIFSPPAVGSGIRALTTTDADAPPAGDIYLFAPQGVIDAGEAGIAGGKVVLGATEVLNARNISFSAGSVGVPAASDASVSLGALSGSSALTENNKMIEQTALGASKSLADSVVDKVGQLMSGWLDVRVISFDEEQEKKE